MISENFHFYVRNLLKQSQWSYCNWESGCPSVVTNDCYVDYGISSYLVGEAQTHYLPEVFGPLLFDSLRLVSEAVEVGENV